MNQTQVLEWQSPYVDLFKYYNVFDGSGHDKKGNIGIFQDTNIGRRVFRIQGSISAVNYVSFPPAKSTIQSLGCNGKYLYLEFFPQEFFFSIHFDFIIPKRNNVRFTLSNLYDSYKVTSSNTLQIPFPKDVRNRWCVVCIDIEKHMEKYGLFPPNTFENFSKIYILKAIQICSTLSIRGIYTSDNLYTPATLPREMDFKMQKGKWEDFYRWIELPVEVTKTKTIDPVRPGKSILKKSSKQQEERSSSRGKSPKDKKKSESLKKGAVPDEIHPVQTIEKIPEKPPVKPEERSKIPWYRPPSKSASAYADQNNSLLSLEYVLGFSGRRCPDIKWSRNGENLQEILFASGNIVVAHDVTNGQQRFFTENTSPVCCLDISKDGTLVAVAQEDKDPCVKVYDFFSTKCLGTIPVKMNEIRSISISNNKAYLSVAGVDTYNRDFLTIWDLETLGQKTVKLVAKQMSEFNILTCKFSPLNDDQLVSCGRENIRFWRIKSDHISGGAVVLTQHARDTVFTVLDFDFTDESSTKRVFVGTKHGLLFQVNYDTRKLEGLFKLHESCICSLSVSAGFCVTGSEDQYLRVWPLDFSEYFLEAKHEGIVISLDISYDSLHVVSGVSSGGLSIIDLSNQSCQTLMRTHTNRIKQIEYHAFSNSFITLSEDLSIKVWNADRRDQIYEFSYSKEDPCTAISADPHGLFIAAGFNSGLLRVFDLERTKVGEEFKYHNTPLNCVLYSPNGKYLVTADRQGNYNLFDVDRSFQPVKVFEAEIGNDNPIAAFTTDSETLATTGAYTNTINLWDLNRFFRRGRIVVKNSTVQALKFSSDDHALFALLHDGKIKMYGARNNEPVLIKDITPASKILSTSLDVAHSKGYLLTGSNDSKLRIWDIINDPSEDKYVFPQGGHTQAISSAIFSSDNQRVFSAGNDEGIYVWNFKGDLDIAYPDNDEYEGFSRMLPGRAQNALSVSKQDESVEVDKLGEEIFVRENEGEEEYKTEEHKSPTLSEVKKQLQAPGTPPGHLRHSGLIKDITNAPRDSPSGSRKDQGEEEMRSMKSEKTHQLSHSPLESRTQMFLKSNKSGIVRRAYKFKKFVPNTRASTSPGKSPRKIEPPARKYIKSAFRENNKLPFKHYALEGDGRLAEQKSKSVFKARSKIELEYYIGYNNDSHSNIVWNIPGGWFAYGAENYVIVEQLNSQRSQKVITFPDFISCLALSKDHTYLAVGTATYDTNIYANVHIIDCYTLKTIRTLKFHNKGIQTLAFSSDSRYLISAGNYRECTIAVWDPSTGQLIASSYTLTNINEIKVKNFPRSGILEFVSVGADQVIQWILTEDSKLLNSETFIQPKNTKTVELTAFSFVLVNERDYILVGTAEGELMLFDLSTGELELRKKLCVEEIVDIHTNNNELKAVITSFDAKIYHWNYSEKLKFDEDSNLTNMELKYPATCIYLEETLNEGLIGTYDGGILYANFHEDLFSKLVGSPSVDNYIIRVKELDDTMFVTFHAFGSIKIWNSISGEELFDFAQPKITCKDVLLHKGRNELLCFYNDNTCKIVSLENFEKVTPYIVDEFMIQPGEESRYIQDSQAIQEQGSDKPYYLCVTNKGEVYVSDLREKDEINWTEAIEQSYVGNVAYFDAHAKQRILNVCFDDGTIQTYSFFRGNQQYPDMSLQDQWNVMDDPHGDLDRNEEARLATLTIYGTKAYRVYKITTAFTEMRGVYFVITQYLQYAFLRNSLTKEILRRISLDSFPLALTYEISTKNVVVGLDDGQIVYYDFEGNELLRQRNFNDGGVISLSVTKDEDNKKLLAIERKGMTIYKYA